VGDQASLLGPIVEGAENVLRTFYRDLLVHFSIKAALANTTLTNTEPNPNTAEKCKAEGCKNADSQKTQRDNHELAGQSQEKKPRMTLP